MAAGDEGTGFTLEGFLQGSIRAGESMRTSITRFRDAGGRIGNQAFRAAFSLERESMLAGPRLADLPTGTAPDRGMFTDWKAGLPGRKFAEISHDIWDPSIGGFTEQKWRVQMTDDMSIQDAIDVAVDQYETGEGDDGPYKTGRIGRSQLTALRYTV